ncbi:MAG: GIY-YIG nuclease family protein [Bacteroidetes bacterium]|nr:GIY-YIG nuclease family protein [Bacteroidota bacterium]
MIFIYTIRQGLGNRKIGVTNFPRKRLKSIRSTYPRARWALLLPTPFIGYLIEKSFHKLLRLFRVTRKGSGRTEWFALMWPVTWAVDLLITAVVALAWYGVWKAFVLLSGWYWSSQAEAIINS